MGGAWDPRYRWFATNVALEMALQVPAFVVGLVGLVRSEFFRPGRSGRR